jgi:hypothetical protein
VAMGLVQMLLLVGFGMVLNVSWDDPPRWR